MVLLDLDMDDKTQKVKYKVYDMMTELYQDGGLDKYTGEPTWNKRGKSWTNIDELQSHFKNLEERRITVSPLWEIIEMAGTKKELQRYPANVLSKKNRKL